MDKEGHLNEETINVITRQVDEFINF